MIQQTDFKMKITKNKLKGFGDKVQVNIFLPERIKVDEDIRKVLDKLSFIEYPSSLQLTTYFVRDIGNDSFSISFTRGLSDNIVIRIIVPYCSELHLNDVENILSPLFKILELKEITTKL